MIITERTFRSDYMHWVKTNTNVRFNLANSGLKSYPLQNLPVRWESLELSGPGAYGYPPLLAEIARHHDVDADCVALAAGTSMANHLAMAVVLSPGDEVLIEHPVYQLIAETAEYLGATVHSFPRLPENNFTLDLEAIKQNLSSKTRLIVITNLHNPSCCFTNEDTLRELGRLARSAGAKVLVDEVYLDVLFEKKPRSCVHLGREFISTNSLTKVYGLSGLRCGWILADPETIEKVRRLNDLFGVNAAHVADQLSVIAFRHLPEIASWAENHLDRNRALAREFFTDVPRWGTVLFPQLPIASEQLCHHLRERYDTCVTPGRFFDTPDRIRIGIGGDTQVLQEGLERIQKALEAL